MIIDVLKSFFAIALELTILFIGISFLISLLQSIIPYKKLENILTGKNLGFASIAALLFAFITP